MLLLVIWGADGLYGCDFTGKVKIPMEERWRKRGRVMGVGVAGSGLSVCCTFYRSIGSTNVSIARVRQ